MGRAARHIDAKVFLYADNVTKSMKEAVEEVTRRREVQLTYNKKHNITPQGIQKAIRAKLVEQAKELKEKEKMSLFEKKEVLLPDEKERYIKILRAEMKQAAKELDFEAAVRLRDKIRAMKQG